MIAKNNVAEFLLASKNPQAEAIIDSDRTYTYGELLTATAKVTCYLRENGAREADRVLLIAENSFFWVVSYLGILRAGLVCVPLPASSSQKAILDISERVAPRFGFVQSNFVSKHGQLLPYESLISDCRVNVVPEVTSFSELTHGSSESTGFAKTRENDLAAVMFTSGSTGKPRGVMVSHRNIIANTLAITEYLELTERDRIMAVLPFYYCFGASLLHTHLRVGGSLVLGPRFLYPEKVLDRMKETRCTGLAGVPSHYLVLLHKSTMRQRQFPNLRYVQQAGGHLPAASQLDLQQALPTTKIFIMYGQTEATARLSYLPPEQLVSKAGSIGKAVPGVKLSVLNEQGTEVEPGEFGEIVAEGPSIANGYWRDAEATAETFRDGKLYTGDYARIDEDGYIYIIGRKREFIKCGGERVSCEFLEQEIMRSGQLLEVAVIGVEDGLLGEAVKAFVVPCVGTTSVESEVREFCRKHLPFQLVPREIVVLDSLPKTETGKVSKEKLREITAAAVQTNGL